MENVLNFQHLQHNIKQFKEGKLFFFARISNLEPARPGPALAFKTSAATGATGDSGLVACNEATNGEVPARQSTCSKVGLFCFSVLVWRKTNMKHLVLQRTLLCLIILKYPWLFWGAKPWCKQVEWSKVTGSFTCSLGSVVTGSCKRTPRRLNRPKEGSKAPQNMDPAREKSRTCMEITTKIWFQRKRQVLETSDLS